MFSDKKEKEAAELGTGQNRINEGTKLKGDIHSKGFFRIDGEIEGNIKTPSRVVIGKSGVITGSLFCVNADIEGIIAGNLDVTGTLTLRSTAKVMGDVSVGKLAVEPGAEFNASCVMKGTEKEKKTEVRNIKNVDKIKSQNHPFDRVQRIQKPKTEPQS
jgi:cytoskeletal protein CcmA (bactofilin family)